MSNDSNDSAPSTRVDDKQEIRGGNSNPKTSGQKQGAGRIRGNNDKTIGTTRRNDRNRYRNVPNTKHYRGKAVKMNSCVFQLHAKRTNTVQIADTMDTLRLYAFTAYKSDIDSMNIIFAEL